MRRLAIVVVCAAALLAAFSSPARAQGYFAPFIGYDFGGDAGNCPSILNDCSEKKMGYGVTFGSLAGGVFGVEEDIGYAPDFFGQSTHFGDNSVLTLMTNLVVGLPVGPIRPYLSGGLGLIRTHVSLDLANFTNGVSQNALGYDIGGGVMIFLPHHLGIRGDYRHIKSTKDFSFAGVDITNTKIGFSRVSVGLVLH